MKKIIVLFMVAVICTLLCACGESPAIFTDSSGKNVEMTHSELMKIYNENEAKFRELYLDRHISLSGTVKSISNGSEDLGYGHVPIYKIELKDGWVIEVVSSHHPEVIDLNKNDKIQVKAKIYETSYYLTLADYVVDVDKSVYDEVEISIVE